MADAGNDNSRDLLLVPVANVFATQCYRNQKSHNAIFSCSKRHSDAEGLGYFVLLAVLHRGG
jgi:hypothetical protein